MSEKVKVSSADQVKAEVILGQGQSRPTDQAHNGMGVAYTHSAVTKNLHKGAVALVQGQYQSPKVLNRVYYNKNHSPTQIESLLNVKIFRANAQKSLARSYTSVVKGKTNKHRVQNIAGVGFSGRPETRQVNHNL